MILKFYYKYTLLFQFVDKYSSQKYKYSSKCILLLFCLIIFLFGFIIFLLRHQANKHMRRAQVKDMISGHNENSEPVTCCHRARVSWRKSILTRDTPSVPREKAPSRSVIGKINKPRCIAVCRNGKRLIRSAAH